MDCWNNTDKILAAIQTVQMLPDTYSRQMMGKLVVDHFGVEKVFGLMANLSANRTNIKLVRVHAHHSNGKIETIKYLRTVLTPLGLKEAKEMTEGSRYLTPQMATLLNQNTLYDGGFQMVIC